MIDFIFKILFTLGAVFFAGGMILSILLALFKAKTKTINKVLEISFLLTLVAGLSMILNMAASAWFK